MEIAVALAVLAIVAAVGLPPLARSLAALRLELAASEVASTLRLARSLALRRGAGVAVRFEVASTGTVRFTAYRDGDGDGVRNADIADGTDPQELPTRRLTSLGRDIRFGFPPIPDLVDPAGRRLDRLQDPVRFNRSNLASFGPAGTATPGTVYLTDGVRRLVAVRITSRSGRIRVLRYDPERRRWRIV